MLLIRMKILEWRVYLWDANTVQIDTEQRVDHFRKAVFCLKSSDGSPKYMVLPEVVKAGLVLARWMQNQKGVFL